MKSTHRTAPGKSRTSVQQQGSARKQEKLDEPKAPRVAPPDASETTGMTKFRLELAKVCTYIDAVPALAAAARRVSLDERGARELRTAYVVDAADALSGGVETGMRLWIPSLDVFFGAARVLQEERGRVIDLATVRMERRERARAAERFERTRHYLSIAIDVATDPTIGPRDAYVFARPEERA